MIQIDNEKVLLLHQLLVKETGGDPNIRDMNLLDSSVKQIYQTFDGEELYKSKEEKAARLGWTLISNHAFVDGNKRIGMHMMLTFLEVNGVQVNFTNEEVADIGFKIANSQMTYEELLEEIYKHKSNN